MANSPTTLAYRALARLSWIIFFTGCTSLTVMYCSGERAGNRTLETGALTGRVVNRVSLQSIALDTLSDSARILELLPDPAGEAIAFTFTDPVHRIARGLGIIRQSQDSVPRLGWPDSVRIVQWTQPHELAFTAGTGTGVFVILDVRADSLITMHDTTTRELTAHTRPAEASSEVRARITRFVDSTRVQPTGQPQRSQLRYTATQILPAPADSAAAFYITGRNTKGEESNSAWYVLDLTTGVVVPVDSVIGTPAALPKEGGAWMNDSTFYFTKDLILHEVRLRRIAQ